MKRKDYIREDQLLQVCNNWSTSNGYERLMTIIKDQKPLPKVFKRLFIKSPEFAEDISKFIRWNQCAFDKQYIISLVKKHPELLEWFI